MPSLGTTYGRGGATSYPGDLVNSDVIVIEGSNMAECHPVAFRWVMKAKEKGATIIHVDPRFTRTSAVADLHVPIRAGSDIAFLGGIIHYILEKEAYFKEYVENFTNAGNIIHEGFQDTEDLEGLFSGWDDDKKKYETKTWSYVDGERDPSLQHPRCVFQILKKHFGRYTPEMVEETCGISTKVFERVAATLCKNSGRDKTAAFCYAVGWTQHSVGVQYIRSAAIIQLLLGNMGRPGGGILALRGHASIQGSTDIPTLYNLLPGYLPAPKSVEDATFEEYLKKSTAPTGWWGEFPKYIVSMLKSWFGEAATKENNYCYDYLPMLTGDHSHMNTVVDMADGKLQGYFVMGENPVVGSMNGALQREGLRGLDWLVVRDFQVTETADFWRDAPEIARGEIKKEDIKTEVFFFPACAHTEKDGTFTNTQRLLQWHHKAVEAKGDTRSELDFVFKLGRRLKELYADEYEEVRNWPIRDLTWGYPVKGETEEPDAEAVLMEIHGYTVADGKPVEGFADLKDDGSTACGCWIYSGAYKDGVNQTTRRKPHWEQGPTALEWGWAWPKNRRVLYNRASADPQGKPWSEKKKLVWWDEEKKKWTGDDVPDFIADLDPAYRPEHGAKGKDAIAGDTPFIMQTDGRGWLFVPSGLKDGPMPTHYEPQESIMENPLYPQQCNPDRLEWRRKDNPYHQAYSDPRFPFLITTYRLTEHHTAGGMSRWLSWLSELQPEMFCEVSPELAAERNLKNGGWATISTMRGEIEARVLVTRRLIPVKAKGKIFHQIGLPYHWSSKGLVRGDAANDLIGFVADPNVSIQESKALTGNIEAGRRSSGRRHITTGQFVPSVSDGGKRRDLGSGPQQGSEHEAKSGEAQEGNS